MLFRRGGTSYSILSKATVECGILIQKVKGTFPALHMLCVCVCIHTHAVGSCFAMLHLMTIHFYDPCQDGLSTPDLWCITVATHTSFLYLVHFWFFSGVHVFFLFIF